MGKGDRRTKRGKIILGTYGKSRSRKKVKSENANEAAAPATAGKKTEKQEPQTTEAG